MHPLARFLTGSGVVLLVAGVVLWLIAWAFPGIVPGRLPGDFHIERPGFTLYFPLTTCILVSVVLSVLAYLLSRLR